MFIHLVVCLLYFVINFSCDKFPVFVDTFNVPNGTFAVLIDDLTNEMNVGLIDELCVT